MARTVLLSEICSGNPELAGLSDKAFRLWVCTLCWSMGQETDGIVSLPAAKYFIGRTARRYVAELVAAELWIPTLDGKYLIAEHVRGMRLWKPGPQDGARQYIPDVLRQAIYDRDGNACLHCGSTESLSLDHIYPHSLGGKDTFENLQTLCRSCNSRKGAMVDG